VSDQELTAPQAIAADILVSRFGATRTRAHETWWSNVVVSGDTADGTVFCKASAEHGVRAEAWVATRLREAGVPVPQVLALGADDRLPGGYWMATAGMPGQAWNPNLTSPAQTAMIIADVARHLHDIHRQHVDGYGWLSDDGHGRWPHWADWLTDSCREALDVVEPTGLLASGLPDRALHALRQVPDPPSASIVNTDLGLSEILVDPAIGRVSGILDWNSAVAGDALLDVATFAMGGPAGDPTPLRLAPLLMDAYAALDPPIRARPAGLPAVYRMLNHLNNASWSVLNHVDDWTAPLCAEAARELTAADLS